jgi:PEP-CTERM motif
MSILTRLTAATAVAAFAAIGHAAPRTGQGTWVAEMHARDIDGNAVALDDANAAFFWNSRTNLTWMANMNQNGAMSWERAVAWAAALDYRGHTDWRLPTIIDSGNPACQYGTDCGYHVETQVGGAFSEWADLYYTTLGNKGYCPPGTSTPNCASAQTGWGLTNTAYFRNMQFAYWSGTMYGSQEGGTALYFQTGTGFQGPSFRYIETAAVAVRVGDVTAVPEPETYATMLLGLCALMVAVRKRPR